MEQTPTRAPQAEPLVAIQAALSMSEHTKARHGTHSRGLPATRASQAAPPVAMRAALSMKLHSLLTWNTRLALTSASVNTCVTSISQCMTCPAVFHITWHDLSCSVYTTVHDLSCSVPHYSAWLVLQYSTSHGMTCPAVFPITWHDLSCSVPHHMA